VLACGYLLMYISIAAASLFIFNEEEQETHPIDFALVARALQVVRKVNKRHRQLLEEANDEEQQAKKRKIKFDYERARTCVMQDYLGADPLFARYFERVFRVSRTITETLIQVCGSSHSFFTASRNAITGESNIYPEVKVLMALKLLSYGVSASAFMDYFQMSDQTGRQCLKIFCRVISNHPGLRAKYMKSMTKREAMALSNMHYHHFGVRGCIGCLDCMHVYWKNCPVAWHGQYEGKEGKASIVLEAVADYTTWIWHNRFGFPGTLNDINIWDQSSLMRGFIDGTYTRTVDFPFRIADKTFQRVWLMVDGIYPELSRFVKTMTVPISNAEKIFVKWQESCRKSVERSFGILQRKFMILSRPIELFYEEDIRNVVNTCIILHNMMVETRLQRDEEENIDWYNIRVDPDEQYEVPLINGVRTASIVPPVISMQQKINTVKVHWPAEYTDGEKLASIKQVIAEHFTDLRSEWNSLYNRDAHFELRDAITKQLLINNNHKN
jgi:Plant transposon protein